jgi:hypothetical protein
MTDQNELEKLRQQIVDRDLVIRRLNALIALNGITVRSKPAIFPSRAELKLLINMVGNVYPSLIDSDAGFTERVENATLWLAFMHRRDVPDVNFPMAYWAEECRDWLGRQAWPHQTDARALLAACIIDRVPYAGPEPGHYNFQPAIGVSIYGVGKPSTAAWRTTLREGIAAPYQIDRTLVSQRSMLSLERVVGIDRG